MTCNMAFCNFDQMEGHFRQTSNIGRTLVGNKLVDHSDDVGAACRRCVNYIFISNLTVGFNWLGKGNCRASRNIFRFGDSVCLLLEFWLYVHIAAKPTLGLVHWYNISFCIFWKIYRMYLILHAFVSRTVLQFYRVLEVNAYTLFHLY